MTALPKITQEPLIHVDATPDDGYVLRILRAHRHNCDCKWVGTGSNALIDVMNEACDKRAKLLDKAISILKRTTGD